jgi:5-formyltetrahydrofolate cyclo-ligase
VNLSVEESKENLRKRFRFERSQRALGGDWLHLLETKEIIQSQVIASYLSYGDEPDTTALNEGVRSAGKTLLLPKLNPDLTLTWIIWDEKTQFLSNKKNNGFKEPVGEIYSGQIDAMIMPALRVDQSGVRLGQGGGSYDRTLGNLAIHPWKVALLHDEELTSENLPYNSYDIKVDAVALPEILVRFKVR